MNKTPKKPKVKEIYVKIFNFSLRKIIAKIEAIKGDAIFNVVNSGSLIFSKQIKVINGIGANISREVL